MLTSYSDLVNYCTIWRLMEATNVISGHLGGFNTEADIIQDLETLEM